MCLNSQTMNYTPSLRVKAAAELELRRRRQSVSPQTLRAFINRVNPRYIWYPHAAQLAAVLQRVADGELSRLMIFMPPRHGKSELAARLLPAYYLYRHPERWVAIASYAAELAYSFSRNARDNYLTNGGPLKDDAAAIKLWETGKGGGLWAAGVGGPATGRGFHLGIIDDPVKNAEEAASDVIQRRNADWYDSVWTTRREPGAAEVLIQTRWNMRDLAGHVLELEAAEPERWHIVHSEAIKSGGVPDYPDTCVLELDGREVGEPLAPDRYPLEKLERLQRRIGPYFWAALYQQSPTSRSGGMFSREMFDIVPALPATPPNARYIRYWDKAGTKDAGAHTAGVLMAAHAGIYYVVDCIMGQWEAGERERVISQTLVADRAAYGSVTTWIEQEPGSGGKESAEATIRNNPGYVIHADRPTGDKATRAEPLAGQAAIRNVKLVSGSWNGRFLDIITAFPHGAIKDPVDAAAGAFAQLAGAMSVFL